MGYLPASKAWERATTVKGPPEWMQWTRSEEWPVAAVELSRSMRAYSATAAHWPRLAS